MSALEDRIASYRELCGAMTERERAETEAEIWALVPPSERLVDGKTYGRGVWLSRKFGGASNAYEGRCALLMAGEAADVLWTRIERDMTLNAATVILREARADRGTELRVAVARGVARYDALGITSSVGKKIIRKSAPGRRPEARKAPLVVESPTVEQVEEAVVGAVAVRVPGSSRAFWADLRARVGAWLGERLRDAPVDVRAELARALEKDLLVLSDEYQTKIEAARKRTLPPPVGRRAVVEACQVLVMDPPPPGAPVDIVVARRHQRRQARAYHPDVHGGSEATREKYEEVMSAFTTLERYNQERGDKRPLLRVVGGGEGGGDGTGTRED